MIDKISTGFVTLVSEDEWIEWAQVPEWQPVRLVMPAKSIFGKKCTYYGDLPCDERLPERAFFALFETASGKWDKKHPFVPFYRVTCMIVLDKMQEGVFRSRYGEMVKVMLADESIVKADRLTRAINEMAITEHEVREGGCKLQELFSVVEETPPNDRVIGLMCFLNDQKMTPENTAFNALLRYSRHGNFPAGLIGAMCDLGTIMRSLATSPEEQTFVTKFSLLIGDVIKKQERMGVAEVYRLIKEIDSSNKLFMLENVLYLHWRYLAEQRNGELDFVEINKTIEEARAAGVPVKDYAGAIWLIGAMAGFKTYASQYHLKKRSELVAPGARQ